MILLLDTQKIVFRKYLRLPENCIHQACYCRHFPAQGASNTFFLQNAEVFLVQVIVFDGRVSAKQQWCPPRAICENTSRCSILPHTPAQPGMCTGAFRFKCLHLNAYLPPWPQRVNKETCHILYHQVICQHAKHNFPLELNCHCSELIAN